MEHVKPGNMLIQPPDTLANKNEPLAVLIETR
jgi:hypothetical protein